MDVFICNKYALYYDGNKYYNAGTMEEVDNDENKVYVGRVEGNNCPILTKINGQYNIIYSKCNSNILFDKYGNKVEKDGELDLYCIMKGKCKPNMKAIDNYIQGKDYDDDKVDKKLKKYKEKIKKLENKYDKESEKLNKRMNVTSDLENKINLVNSRINEEVNKVKSEVANEVKSSIVNEVMSEVKSSIVNEVVDQVKSSIINEVIDQVKSSIINEVVNQTKDGVTNEVIDQVNNKINDIINVLDIISARIYQLDINDVDELNLLDNKYKLVDKLDNNNLESKVGKVDRILQPFFCDRYEGEKVTTFKGKDGINYLLKEK